MIKNYEDWATMDDLYMLLHTYVSDRLLKRLFDAGKKAGIESEQEKHKFIPIPLDDEEYEELDGRRVFIKSESGRTRIGLFKKEVPRINCITRYNWYDDNGEIIDESLDEIIAWQPLPEV